MFERFLLPLSAAFMSYGAGAQTATPAADRTEAANLLDEITVTARKRTENVLEIPESIVAISDATIERQLVKDLSGIGNLVPNLYMSTRADGVPNVTIRGLGSFGNTQGVGFYIDDVQMFADATSRFGDLERIEVLKGPQGILLGGSNIGGAVKYVARRPQAGEFSGSASLRAGQDSYYDGQLSLNLPIGEQWAARIFGFAYTDDSFLRNPNSQRLNGEFGTADSDAGQREETGVRVTLAGPLSERFSAYLTARYNDYDGPNNYWVRELNPGFEYPEVLDTTFNPRLERDTFAASLELVYDFGAVQLTSLTGYSETGADRTVDIDLSQEYIIDSLHDQDYESFSQELRLASAGDGPFKWMLGAYYAKREAEEFSNLLIGAAFGGVVPTPEEEQQPPLVLPFRNYEQEREHKALFANFSYRTGDLEWSAGVRSDNWESYRLNYTSGFAGDQDDTETLLRGSVSWFATDNSMLYATIAEGFEPGDFNLTNFDGVGELLGYGPENALNYEVGYKGMLHDNRVRLTFAAFLVDYEDRQFELQVDNPNGEGIVEGIINIGDSTQWGIEGELAWVMSDSWTTSLGVGYLDAEWDDGVVSSINDADLSGTRPPYTPEWGATFALNYDRELSGGTNVFGGLQVVYKDSITTNSQFLDVPGDDFPVWSNPSFTLVHLNAGFNRGPWGFSVLVENLFDEDYYIDAQEFPNFAWPIPQSAVIIGTVERTRRVSAVVDYRF